MPPPRAAAALRQYVRGASSIQGNGCCGIGDAVDARDEAIVLQIYPLDEVCRLFLTRSPLTSNVTSRREGRGESFVSRENHEVHITPHLLGRGSLSVLGVAPPAFGILHSAFGIRHWMVSS
jgi:hypothetical protein